MTNLYVQEFAGLGETTMGDSITVPAEPPLASYVISYSAGAAGNTPYNAATKFLTVQADSICSVRFDGNVATITDRRLAPSLAPLLVAVGNVPTGHVSAITNT